MSLDVPTIELLRLFKARSEERAAALGIEPPDDARSALVLLDAARQVLLWERGDALTEARE